jgi:tetratricopeptide (TPR) repeat protein
MASVFLSYVREDAEKAQALAGILERAGHSVWWDRQIRGGAQYSAEIESALTAAEKVVVLWSDESVTSAWVRDEAAAGRDTGRLIPIVLDNTQPPLGFRQFQTIDFSRWKGRSRPPQLRSLLDALGDQSTPARRDGDVASSHKRFSFRSYGGPATALATATILALGGGGWWWASRADAHPPTVAIEGMDKQSREMARELTLRLGELQSARGDTFKLTSGGASADLIVQIDAADSSEKLRRDVAILSGNDRSILWSASLQQPPSKRDDLSQQLTLTSERVLSCALEAFSARSHRVETLTLKQYLNGCSRIELQYGQGQYDPALSNLFEQVVARAPHFEGAWARLLQTEIEVARSPDPPPALVDKLRAQIGEAVNLGIDIGEVYAAKAALLPTSDFLGTFALYDQGIRTDPANAYLYRLRGERLQAVGRMTDSVGDASQALQLDPLSPALMDNYASSLAYAGKIEAAFEQLRKAEEAWPAADNLRFARYRLNLRFGDPKQALTMFRSIPGLNGDPAQEAFLEARIQPTPANIEMAINAERQVYAQEPREIFGLMQALGEFGRTNEAIGILLNYKRLDALGYNAEVLFRPMMRDMWRDPRSMAAAAHVGLLRYWLKSGKWPDFCFDPTLPYDCKAEAAKYAV